MALLPQIRAISALMRAGLQLRFQQLRLVINGTTPAPIRVSDETLATAIELGHQIEYLADRSPIPILCLQRAIALRNMLYHKKIPNKIVFGYLPKSIRQHANMPPPSTVPSEVFNTRTATKMISKMAGRNAHVWITVQSENSTEPCIIIGAGAAPNYTKIAQFD